VNDVRVLVVDDQPGFRAALRALLDRTPGFAIAGEAGTGEEGVEAAVLLDPDLVLMDVNLPGISGIDATRLITEGGTTGPIVVLVSTADEVDLPADARTCGAAAYRQKVVLTAEVLAATWRRHRPDREVPGPDPARSCRHRGPT